VVENPYLDVSIPLNISIQPDGPHPNASFVPVIEALKDPSLFLHPAERFFLRRFAQRSRIKLEGIERMKIWENLNGAEGYQVSPTDWVIPLRSPTLPPAKHTNLVVLGEPGLIIDPAATMRNEQQRGIDMIRTQKRQGITHQAIFLTHHHHDHIGAAQRFAQDLSLPIWAHETTAQLLGFQIHRTFADDEVLPTATGEDSGWIALHTPGHAPGHLCLWNPQSRQLVAGDMVAGVGTILIDPEDGDMGLYLESLERLADLKPRFIYPAHGPVISEAEGWLRFYIQHRLEREEKVLNAMGKDACTADDLLGRVYDDVAPAILPLASRSLESHLRKLINEERIERDLFGEIRRIKNR
jgi:glyoxylase-like metal-dependent hydrolase (beta-lactamase superfamily II)